MKIVPNIGGPERNPTENDLYKAYLDAYINNICGNDIEFALKDEVTVKEKIAYVLGSMQAYKAIRNIKINPTDSVILMPKTLLIERIAESIK